MSGPGTRYSRRRVGLLLAAGLLAACGATGRDPYLPADTAVDPYAALRAQADEYYRQGQEQFRRGEYRQALDSFEQARLHDPGSRPELDAMIGRAREALASASGTPAPSPTLPGAPLQTFSSRVYNYAITYPSGWRAEGASQRAGDTQLDAFAEEGGVASALVFAFAPPVGSSQDGLVRESLALRQKGGTAYRRLGVRPVDDSPAVIVTYTDQRPDGAWLAVRQAVFQRDSRGWAVAVAAPLPDAARYAGVLDQMLDGFRISAARRA